jgi:hypothetical protein
LHKGVASYQKNEKIFRQRINKLVEEVLRDVSIDQIRPFHCPLLFKEPLYPLPDCARFKIFSLQKVVIIIFLKKNDCQEGTAHFSSLVFFLSLHSLQTIIFLQGYYDRAS